jgi:hypothetical protein
MVSLATAAPTITIGGGLYQVGGGGEITATVGSSSFQTFCVELNEHIALGGTYNFDINTGAVKGGVGGQTLPNFDPLDEKTAWLYTAFRQTTLKDYAFAGSIADHRASAGALQEAIWNIEQEISGPLSTLAQDYYDQAAGAVKNGWEGIGDVRVLNLYTTSAAGARTDCQDVLGYFPPGVPVPGAILLGGLGCALVGFLRRRGA